MNSSAGLVTLIEFVLAFGLLIFLHELGHFIAAKSSKIEVEEFGFGFPPRIFRLFNLSGTDITINLIPLGGFVRLKGENDPEVPGGMGAANPWKRLGVLLAGSTMNLLTGILLFSFVFSQIGAPDYQTVQIMDIAQNSPAALAGIQIGDVVYDIEGQRIESMEELSQIIKDNLGKAITVTLVRDGTRVPVQVIPREKPPVGEGALGIMMTNPSKDINIVQSIPYGAMITFEQAKQLFLLPGRLINGQVDPEEARFVGPKGIFDMYSQARERDLEATASSGSQAAADIGGLNTVWLMAIISIAIGLTNLLPIPALDGGRILFIIPEILFKKRVPPQYENVIHFIGFSALILLMIYITTQDFINPIQLP
jgi:regulator of sigma E protease